MFGFLNVYKPKGITSHDVVSALRRITKVKQIGHTGTLDPFAEGVLPICIGKATRLIEYLDDDKAYTGTIQLGSSTTTYDLEGEEVNFSDKKVTFNEIEAALDKFRGEIEQLPPIYSAIKVNGKKLYEYAREGKEVKIEPRGVNISNLQILNFYPETRQLELHIECSKGTYIRSIANDLGEELGTYGHLVKLVRVKAGMFEVNNAVSLEHIQTKEDVEKLLIAPLTKLNYMTYELNKNELVKVSNGTAIMPSKELPENSLILLTSQERLIAAAKMTKGLLKCLKVLG
ncbi:TPA: tRNA pseudouridine(55) synthase TruB [Candidatus Gastranaerophilales bacterium HUM_10]|jgi:tRNA pseudouridine synthase B|nr:tRNA pseudouridine synthase B [Acinetobacter sp. CAG:196]DAA98686.1 MAG TPA: tRNA pseudouridine(55) synthase TruB [Candidatus Gastranaerophilales bacterium HUM_10]DAB11988.1 MAG TPA: tRNA pseudouridine(55) synthase TruB [Candidatus Gastranaerophilales bacterium HUM_16]